MLYCNVDRQVHGYRNPRTSKCQWRTFKIVMLHSASLRHTELHVIIPNTRLHYSQALRQQDPRNHQIETGAEPRGCGPRSRRVSD